MTALISGSEARGESAAGNPTPVAQVVDVDGIPSSGLLIEAANPRAVIIALHGGAASAAYFDCPGHPDLSMMRTAAALGFTVLALDRPGYRASKPHDEQFDTAESRVDFVHAARDAHLGDRPRGAGTFFWAHSVGCELALRCAIDDRDPSVLGIEIAGTGIEYSAEAAEVLGGPGRADSDRVRNLIWRPENLYPAALIGGGTIASASARYEYTMIRNWSKTDFPAVAAQLRVPMHYTAAEHEHVWRTDTPALEAIRELFPAAPRVHIERQIGIGHQLSLGHMARAYHTRVLTFFEECLATQASNTAAQGNNGDDPANPKGDR
ncbi:alpha/beta hydrolase [Aldersonia sp. NBC_00410]|uniref:alpha/beta hydrolase n=1 Tax=Aldersonia sp. NBC_00410 TaxID=2975954 RepID=UPI002252D114|nr:alpha/beta hydrolase [Aldersonia sp. NBC_00410]MCX5044250.1 alpha/beta hydrolase [Aldersonia sp. NBC_00410]